MDALFAEMGEKLAWPRQVLVNYLTLLAETRDGYANLCRLLMSGGLFLELFAILALCGRRFAAAYGALLIVFHILVRSMTGLNFRYHIAALFIFLILPTLISFIQNLSAPRSAAKVNEL